MTRAVAELKAAIEALTFTDCQAPTIPEEYTRELETWQSAAFAETKMKKGRRTDEREILGPLLAIYQASFRVRPSGAVGGPTARFVTGFLAELRGVMQTAQWANVPSSAAKAPAIPSLFDTPVPNTLRTQIDRSSHRKADGELVQRMFWVMYRGLIDKTPAPLTSSLTSVV